MADTEVIQNGVANGEMDEVNSESKEDIGKPTEEKEEEEKTVDEEPPEDSREQGDGSEEQATNDEHKSLDSRGGDDPGEEPEQQEQEEEGGVEEESTDAPGGEEESQIEEESSRNEKEGSSDEPEETDEPETEVQTSQPHDVQVEEPNSGSHEPVALNMSVTAEVNDIEALTQALGDVRNDGGEGVNRKSWVLVGHVNNNPNQIQLVGQDTSGEANIDDFATKLEDDQVMYGFIRMSATVDMNTTVKFVYVHWHGENVPFARKGRFGVVHGSIVQHFHPFHLQIETGNREDLTEDEITKRLDESSFSTNRILSSGDVEGRQHRGFTQHQVPRSTSGTVHSLAPAGASVNIDPEVNESIGGVRDDKNALTWIVAGFEDGDPKKQLVVMAKGEGDIEELKESLKDDQVQYALYRTSDIIDAITTVKFVYIYWIGEDVKALVKGKVSAYAGPVEKVFSPAHVTLSFSNKGEMDESVIRDKVMAGSGSKSFVK